MPVQFRNYRPRPRYGEDYRAVRAFLLRLQDISFTFGRWDWMVSHSWLEENRMPDVGLWEEGGEIVGIAAFDTLADGKCFLPLLPGYEDLRGEMIRYAAERLRGSGALRVFIHDGDEAFQQAARGMGFHPTQEREPDAVMPIIPENLRYSLPEGFRITDMREDYDLLRYSQVLWKGFNHEKNGEGPFDPNPETMALRRGEFERPNVDPDLKIAVVAPSGDFVSYCGMWHDPATPYTVVEPVATDPAYRRMGLGRAAVLEGVRRCGQRGAKWATVGSGQQFYYDIGFNPHLTSTFWSEKDARPEG